MENTQNKKIVLIVDDDKFLLDMYAIKFVEKGFQVETANSGPEVLRKIEDGLAPDIFLVDIVMPTMDGFELMQDLAEKFKNKVLIFLSNLGQKEDIERGLSIGADGYIVKASTTPSEVLAKVIEIASNKK
ncbi:MAG: response regulator [Candidatus Vogelbacteria bacterium]|nr:response regulator [Candidatus Vogelbacteria bacterium]